MSSLIRGIITELGLRTVINAPRDVHLLILQRACRLIAYGQSTLVLTSFFQALGFSDVNMGLFMTLTLVGDVFGSAVLTIYADRWGRRKVLMLGCCLMAFSGVVFMLSSSFVILLSAAIVGVISPSGGDIGPFKAVEESTLAQLLPAEDRSTVFAWYAVLSGVAAATGSLSGGWITKYLQDSRRWTPLKSYRLIYGLYSIFALLKLASTLNLSENCEPRTPARPTAPDASEVAHAEEYQLMENGQLPKPTTVPAASRRPALIDKVLGLTPETRQKLGLLSALFGLDNLASGLVPLSFVIYFFSTKFNLDEATLGNTFFITTMVAAMSNLVAASLSRRIGNIKTMAFTHLPSSTFLAMLPLPSNFQVARALLICRFCTAQMDGAPRTAFLASYLPDNERTAVMGAINVVKTIALSIGPAVTGYLSGKGLISFSFFAAGSMKASYDLAILYFFSKAQMVS